MARKKPSKVAPPGGWPRGKKAIPPSSEPKAREKRVVTLDLDNENVRERRPVWRFADLDNDGPWSLSACTPSDLPDIFAKLRDYERMTIREIFHTDDGHGKTYPVETIPKHARDRLTEIKREDETELVRLRFGGRKRFYGILREHVFHVLWWDPEHQVFPSRKRNT